MKYIPAIDGLRGAATVYYPYFDYLRGVAAIGVFLAHADTYHIAPSQLGNGSVQIFFALSGYLIGGILLRSKTGDIPRFYFNRSTRIWIPYAIAIGVLFAATLIKQGFSDPKFAEFFIYKATFVYNWFGPPQLAKSMHHMPLDGTGNHFWSICVEEQFYLVAPFVLLLLNRAAAAASLAGLVALNFFVPHDFAAIALGVLLAITGRSILFISASALIAILSLCFLRYSSWMPFVGVTIVALAAQPGANPTQFGKVIGGASYPFYLNHWIGLFGISACMKAGIPYPVSLSIGFSVASAIAVSHYFTIDRWIAHHRSGIFTERRGLALCASGFALVASGVIYGVTR
jgi:peptidoglycan/LPS O-acetylase OafA/YrhL